MTASVRMFEQLSGQDLAALRGAAGLTQAQLAQAAGVGRHAVSYWEQKAVVEALQHAPRRMIEVLGVKVGRAVFRDAIARASGDGVLHAEQAAIARMEARRAAKAQAKPKLSQTCRQVRCGARTRKGHPCRLLSEPDRRRCKFHGGRSTGPRTPEGRARIAEAQRHRWASWRARQRGTSVALGEDPAVEDDDPR